jgi:DNA-binding FadR family transcriptional regulator
MSGSGSAAARILPARPSKPSSPRGVAVRLPPVEPSDEPRRGLAVAEQLRNLVEAGSLEAGDRLPTEDDLAIHFGVSRVTIREALQMLRALGLVEATRGRGTFVSRPDAAARLHDLAYFSFESEGAVDDLFEVRTLLETRAAARASQRSRTSERQGLISIVGQMRPFAEDERSDAAQLAELDTQFHLGIAEISGNLVLEQLMRRLMQVLAIVRTRSLAVPGQRLRSWEQHRRIAEAVERGDSELAVARVVEHMDSVRRAVLSPEARQQ